MKKLVAAVWCLAIFTGAAFAQNDENGNAAEGSSKAKKVVYVLPVQGAIDKSMLFVLRRAFRQAEQAKPDAIVIDMETPGGGLRETEEIIDWLRSLDVPQYTFVNTHAQSAGAIISLATDKIFMAKGSRIGSAMPILVTPGGGVQELPPDIKEKILSDVRAMVRGLAQENGHNEDIAEAMVDPQKEVIIGEQTVSAKGQLLNFTAEDAVRIIPPDEKPVLAEAIVDDIDSLLKREGFDNYEIVRFEEQPAERLARYLTLIGPLLLTIGLIGIYIEFKTPGFGLPGITGAVCLTIYFFGHYVAGLAGAEEIFLVVLGFVLLAVEIFVIPGFGITGVAGLICIFAGVTMGLLPHLPNVPELPGYNSRAMSEYFDDAARNLLITFALTGVGIWAMSRILPKTTVYRNLVLESALAQGAGRMEAEEQGRSSLVGAEGVCLTALRPSGTVVVNKQRLDVVSTGDMIPKNTVVRIVEVEGNRIVVEAVTPA